MKSKNLIILFIIFVFLMVIVLIKKATKPKVPTREEWLDIIVKPVNLNSITDCVITLGEKEVHLAKKSDNWVVQSQYEAPVDEQKLTSLLEKLDKLEGELRSDDKKLFDDYSISDDQAVHIKLNKKNSEITHLLIGSRKYGWRRRRKNFVRLNGENAVYAVREKLLMDLDFWRMGGDVNTESFNTDMWSDKHIVRFDLDKAVSIKISEGKKGAKQKGLDLVRESFDGKNVWKFGSKESSELSEEKVKNYIETLGNTRADKITDSEMDYDFDSLPWELKVFLENGEPITVIRGMKEADDSNYYLKYSDANYIYVISKETFNNLSKANSDFFIDKPAESEQKS